MKKIFIIIAAAGIVSYLSIKKLIDSYKITIKKVKMNWNEIENSGGKFIVLDLVFNFINPTNTEIKINRVNFYIFYKGKLITQVLTNNVFTINKKSITEIPTYVAIDYKNAIIELKPVLSEFFTKQKFDLTIKGFMQAGIFKIPFETVYTIEL